MLLFFSVVKYSTEMASKMEAITVRMGKQMVFVMIHCTEKVTDSYLFVKAMLLLSVFINPFTTIKATLTGTDDTIISYYSHKSSYSGQTLCQK